MTRAVLLPSAADPYINQLWLNSYRRFWKSEVDKLYVCVNTPIDESVRNFVVNQFREVGAEVLVEKHLIDHGPALTKLLHLVGEDFVFITEDDFFIKESGHVNRWFEAVESNSCDLIGSMRGCTSNGIISATARQFGLTGPEGAQTNFWPCLVVVSRENLQRTDLNFAGKRFIGGQPIQYIDYTPSVDEAGDTFVWASIQLRGLGLRCRQEKQYRLIDVIQSRNWNCPWIHLGSSCTSMNGMLINDDFNSIITRSNPSRKDFNPIPPDAGLMQHYARQIGFLFTINRCLPIKPEAAYFNPLYASFIESTLKLRQIPKPLFEQAAQQVEQILLPLL